MSRCGQTNADRNTRQSTASASNGFGGQLPTPPDPSAFDSDWFFHTDDIDPGYCFATPAAFYLSANDPYFSSSDLESPPEFQQYIGVDCCSGPLCECISTSSTAMAQGCGILNTNEPSPMTPTSDNTSCAPDDDHTSDQDERPSAENLPNGASQAQNPSPKKVKLSKLKRKSRPSAPRVPCDHQDCDGAFSTERNRARHVQTMHTRDVVYICKKCWHFSFRSDKRAAKCQEGRGSASHAYRPCRVLFFCCTCPSWFVDEKEVVQHIIAAHRPLQSKFDAKDVASSEGKAHLHELEKQRRRSFRK